MRSRQPLALTKPPTRGYFPFPLTHAEHPSDFGGVEHSAATTAQTAAAVRRRARPEAPRRGQQHQRDEHRHQRQRRKQERACTSIPRAEDSSVGQVRTRRRRREGVGDPSKARVRQVDRERKRREQPRPDQRRVRPGVQLRIARQGSARRSMARTGRRTAVLDPSGDRIARWNAEHAEATTPGRGAGTSSPG